MERPTPRVSSRSLRSGYIVLSFSLLAVIFGCTTALAQKDTGAILGTVRDASGAVVSGAKVTIRDADRGTSLLTSTNAQGEYVASPLKIGRYNVVVEKTGFRKAVAGPIVVNV